MYQAKRRTRKLKQEDIMRINTEYTVNQSCDHEFYCAPPDYYERVVGVYVRAIK